MKKLYMFTIILMAMMFGTGCIEKDVLDNASEDRQKDDIMPTLIPFENSTSQDALDSTAAANTTENATTNNIKKVVSLEDARNTRITGSMGGSGGSSGNGGSHHNHGGSDSSEADDEVIEVVETASLVIENKIIGIAGKAIDSPVTSGDIINYQINVTNTGNVNLTGVGVYDYISPKVSLEMMESINANGVLEPSEIWSYIGNQSVSEQDVETNGGGDGFIENVAVVECSQCGNFSSRTCVPLEALSYVITVSGVDTSEDAATKTATWGDNIKYQLNVANTGNKELTNIVVRGSISQFAVSYGDTDNDAILDAKEVWSYDSSYTVNREDSLAGSINNIVTVDCNELDSQVTNANTQTGALFTSHTVKIPADYADPEHAGAVENGATGEPIVSINNNLAVDPTYAEVVAFIKADPTDLIMYQDGIYVCADYARDVHNNAEKAGYRCAWVGVDMWNNNIYYGHALNAFQTTDRGLIFVDCTSFTCPNFGTCEPERLRCGSDKIAHVVKGDVYASEYLYVTDVSCGQWETMYTVDYFYLDW
jgi:uncharacterized repeat protein (TIGR01451 family)